MSGPDRAGRPPDVSGGGPGAAAAAAWAARVRGNREQVDRFRETEDEDFYGPISGMFIADPRRTDDPSLDRLLALARPTDRWLDIGAGAGRFALPLALRIRSVIALDPSEGMLASLREQMVEHGIDNIELVHGRWPLDARPAGGPIEADVALIAHLGYDVEDIAAFLDAMEQAADRLCVAVLSERVPAWLAEPFWPAIHGEERIALPALPEFLELLTTRGRAYELWTEPRLSRAFRTREDVVRWLRKQLWLAPGGAKDRMLDELLDDWLEPTVDGLRLTHQRDLAVGVVAWPPA
jgi:SAM-dependent methyltransferase